MLGPLSALRSPHSIEVVGAIIRANNRYLVGQRPAGKAQAGLWEFMGGKIEAGETPEAALARECREELALEICNPRFVVSVVHEYPDKTVHLHLYACEPAPHSTAHALEHQDIRWCTAAELRALAFCPADAELLDLVLLSEENELPQDRPVRLPSEPRLTPFVRRVLEATCRIPRGRVTTYGALAAAIGCRSAQAVGQALRRNPWAPAVPCHRVVSADGRLHGYCGASDAATLTSKRALLEAEGVEFLPNGSIAPK